MKFHKHKIAHYDCAYSLSQNDFEKMLSACTSKISSFHFNETKLLNQKLEQERLKLEQQSAEIEKLQSTCAEHTATIQQLNETITILQNSNEDLKLQLQEKENFEFESEEEEVIFESCKEETTNNKIVSSLPHSFTSSPVLHVREKRCHSDLANQVTWIVHEALKSFHILFLSCSMLKLAALIQ